MSGIVSAPLLAPRGQGQATQSGRGQTGVHAETEVPAETEIFQTRFRSAANAAVLERV